ncbi:MAG: two component transcriptional regulator, winged helix family [Anaerocolumna sp.]|nr:two component transcriptional regulator, winged helix family [Anaerocolumna sp.]
MDQIKVLVVDDESRMRKLVKDFLSKRDYEVIEAENGEQAVDIFFQNKEIGLIILDVMMPKMDGWQVCREIRQYAHEVKINNTSIDLSIKEFELLSYFVANQGVALSRERILNNVWNYDYFGDARTIDTHVKKLRSKMGDKGDYIKTIWGMGYKFEVSE